MRSGAPLIYQAQFFDGRWQGRTDFLRRVEIASALGVWSYEVLDAKLARHVKPQFVHQLSVYSRLLGRVQGVEPDTALRRSATAQRSRSSFGPSGVAGRPRCSVLVRLVG
jgi:predicted RecB family nuclease